VSRRRGADGVVQLGDHGLPEPCRLVRRDPAAGDAAEIGRSRVAARNVRVVGEEDAVGGHAEPLELGGERVEPRRQISDVLLEDRAAVAGRAVVAGGETVAENLLERRVVGAS